MGLRVVDIALNKDIISAIRTFERITKMQKVDPGFADQLIVLRQMLEEENKHISANRIIDLYAHITGNEMPFSEISTTLALVLPDL